MYKKAAKTKFVTWICVVMPLALGLVKTAHIMINLWCSPAGPAVECFELVHCVGVVI